MSFVPINEMVFAMLFVVAVGLGPFAGYGVVLFMIRVLASYFWSGWSDRPRPAEALEPTGANNLRKFFLGIPQSFLVDFPIPLSIRIPIAVSHVSPCGALAVLVILWESMRGFNFQNVRLDDLHSYLCVIMIYLHRCASVYSIFWPKNLSRQAIHNKIVTAPFY